MRAVEYDDHFHVHLTEEIVFDFCPRYKNENQLVFRYGLMTYPKDLITLIDMIKKGMVHEYIVCPATEFYFDE